MPPSSTTPPLALISSPRFHRRTTLSTAHGPLTISFADIGCATGPALLFLPGMFASRYLGTPMHILAERAGVRLLVIDRPGMGTSTDVPLAQRIDVWVDMLPQLLGQLDIPRVSLVAHSAGAIYLLNTLVRCRAVVRPAVFFLAPWVDPAHSRVTAMQIAQYLPIKAFSMWHHIPRFFVTQASPVLASSGAVMRRVSSSRASTSQTGEEDRTFLDANWRRVERDYGVSREESAELTRLAVNSMFAENTVGANSEALQCLRKGDGADWGVYSDYGSCVRALGGSGQAGLAGGGVISRTYFAAQDALVGSRGQRYFEEGWKAQGVQGVEFFSRVIDGTDHDTVIQSVEVWEEILTLVAEDSGL
ncbi:Alpha/Beta hydrolase protein [Aspergillus cavernicola]|uniref:Alpha/Beta hydrolase protein n=1 Tax=Aspergillus cavernicola TaxID=176166 RepID=A0ABR4I0X8_9EURO